MDVGNVGHGHGAQNPYLCGNGIHRDKQQERVDVSASAGVVRRHLARSVGLPVSRHRAVDYNICQGAERSVGLKEAKHSYVTTARSRCMKAHEVATR